MTNSPVTYDGAAHAATVSGSVAGVVSNILTGGSATQTNIGTYPVTADFAPTDSANYNSLTGASAGNFVISTAVKPPATTLVSPNGTISATTPTYTWNAVSTSTWYLLQVNGPSGTVVYQWYTAAAVGCGSGTGTCSIAPSTTLANGAYTFWVLTYNSAGDGTWSSGMAFTVSAGVVKPPATTLVSPTGTITTGTPTYTWNAVSTSTWYLLQVNGPSGTVIYNWYTAAEVGCAGGTGTCSIAPSVTLPNGAYTFWVLTYNSAGDGTWSSGMAFTVNVGAATLVSPTGLIGTSTPTYTWNAVSTSTWYLLQVNGPSGKVVYNWYTAADAGCGGGTGTCSVTPSTSLTSGAYTWWIMTYTTRDGPWSSGMGFTVP